MPIRTLCLGPSRRDECSATSLLRTAALALRGMRGLGQMQLLRVLRHIPTDSLNDRQAPARVVGEADRIVTVLELHFDTPGDLADGHQRDAWAAFMEQVRSAAPLLFMLDMESNVPIAPTGAAASGGFRRWMLLARKADAAEQFREAWFGRHAELVKRLPHVDGYLQNLVTQRYDAQGREVAYEVLPIDGVAELCFADEAAMNAAYGSGARVALRDDGRALLGRITTILMHEERWT